MTWREGETESHALLASSEGRPPTITFKMAAIALFCRTRVFGRNTQCIGVLFTAFTSNMEFHHVASKNFRDFHRGGNGLKWA
jgi:hypothetical protein